MSGLVAAYLVFYPLATPTMPIEIDRGVKLEGRWCGKNLGKAFHPEVGTGTARIVCKGKPVR